MVTDVKLMLSEDEYRISNMDFKVIKTLYICGNCHTQIDNSRIHCPKCDALLMYPDERPNELEFVNEDGLWVRLIEEDIKE